MTHDSCYANSFQPFQLFPSLVSRRDHLLLLIPLIRGKKIFNGHPLHTGTIPGQRRPITCHNTPVDHDWFWTVGFRFPWSLGQTDMAWAGQASGSGSLPIAE